MTFVVEKGASLLWCDVVVDDLVFVMYKENNQTKKSHF